MAGLIVRPRSRIFHGHDWVYASEILKTFGEPQDGTVVSLRDGRDRFLGSAIYNGRSQIVARRFSRRRQDLDADFFRRRIARAVEYRAALGLDLRCRRLVWSESDGLPGLVVDRYGEVAVMQTLTLAMDRQQALIAETVAGVTGCRTVIARNDAPLRKAEGLPAATAVLVGDAPAAPIPCEVAGVRFEIDPLGGQKTGFYLDQIENCRLVAARAAGRRVLDCFANRGAFALACARAGAREVVAVELSADGVAAMAATAAANGLAVRPMAANAFDFLKESANRGDGYDLIILDPPSFTRTKGRLQEALRGYHEIHRQAFRLLAPGGLLATFCCSYHVGDATFREAINEAAVDAACSARVLCRFGQAADHPVLLALPETEYLKGYLLELLAGR